jgi:RNA recognition motif-containing protein
MNIFVARLDYGVTTEELNDLFAEYGNVDSAKVVMDRDTGRSKGFGFVEMGDDAAAKEAIEALNGKNIRGRDIVVKVAEERESRGGGGGRSGGGGFQRRY